MLEIKSVLEGTVTYRLYNKEASVSILDFVLSDGDKQSRCWAIFHVAEIEAVNGRHSQRGGGALETTRYICIGWAGPLDVLEVANMTALVVPATIEHDPCW